jgi:hypothetical protein
MMPFFVASCCLLGAYMKISRRKKYAKKLKKSLYNCPKTGHDASRCSAEAQSKKVEKNH